MNYDAAELLQFVKRLSEKYTGKASTSVTYETAQQLMEAVLYCIHEAHQDLFSRDHEKGGLLSAENFNAGEAYRKGQEILLAKVQEAKRIYNQLTSEFQGYGNYCYETTILQAMPEFFKWYDIWFAPQETVIGLDYPTLMPMGSKRGIDAVYEYLNHILTEQRFLSKLDADYVLKILGAYPGDYRELVLNIPYLVLKRILTCRVFEVPAEKEKLMPEEITVLEQNISGESRENLTKKMRDGLDELLEKHYGADPCMRAYFQYAIPDIVMELKNAATFHTLVF